MRTCKYIKYKLSDMDFIITVLYHMIFFDVCILIWSLFLSLSLPRFNINLDPKRDI